VQRVIVFPPFQLDPENEQISREGIPLELRPKAFAVLRHLAERPGQLVTKEDLLAAVWPETFVSDTVLKVCVNELRRALGEDASTPSVIQTVHRRGYRFIARLAGAPPGTKAAPSASVATPEADAVPSTARPLSGRDAERSELDRALAEALTGRRRVVFLSGEAGIGKTALLDAFLRDAARGTEPLWITRGQCVAQYGAGEAFLPVLEALLRLCRSSDGVRVVERMRTHAPDWLLQLPGQLDPAERADLQRQATANAPERMLRLVVDLLEVLAVDRPLVLALEDLHWSDPSTIDLVARVAEREDPARLLLLCTYRPAEAIARNHPLRAVKLELQMRRRCREILLGFLDEAATEDHLRSRFPGAALPAGLATWLHRRTDGNPLFMVSVVQELVAAGVVRDVDGLPTPHEGFAGVGVPEDLRQMIEQQIDRLEPADQRLLEAAAVAGAEFTAAAVAAAIDGDLMEVEERLADCARRAQLLRTSGRATWPDGTVSAQFAFIHALYREVEYQRIAPARRARLHRRIGERLELAYGVGSRDAPADLAVHFEECGEPVRAVLYHRKTAARALRRGAHREVIASLDRAVALLERQPPVPERSRELLGLHLTIGPSRMATCGLADDGVRASFEAARVLSEQVGDTGGLFLSLAGLWGFHFARAEQTASRTLAERLTELADRLVRELGDKTPLYMAHTISGAVAFLEGDLENGRARLEAALATGIDPPVSIRPDLKGLCLGFLASTLALLGFPEQALRRDEEARAHAKDRADAFDNAAALLYSAQLRCFLRDSDGVSAVLAAGVGATPDRDLPWWRTLAQVGRGWSRALGGDPEGPAELEEGIASFRRMGGRRQVPFYLSLLADVRLREGDAAAAERLLDDAQAQIESTGERAHEPEIARLQGQCWLALARDGRRDADASRGALPEPVDALAEAEHCFERAVTIAARQGSLWWELRATTDLARLWSRGGRPAEARALLARVYDRFTEGFDTPDLRDARELLASL
jgi:DNA-binding winged helix-turn-helix (wHTH) protein/predicted ATPase